jgi:hypothetical protein
VLRQNILSNGTDNGRPYDVRIEATLARINATLGAPSGLTYQPTLNYNGPDQLTITVDDRGQTGSAGAAAVPGVVSITVTAVNDPPNLALALPPLPPNAVRPAEFTDEDDAIPIQFPVQAVSDVGQ